MWNSEFVSVQFSCSVMSDSLWPHGLQHARIPCPYQLTELTQTHVHRVGDAIQTYHPTSFPSSPAFNFFPASGTFPRNQFFTSGGQSIEVSASASVYPMNVQGWFPLGLTGLISWLSNGLSKVSSSTTVQKYQFFDAQASLWSNSHIHTWLPEKP